ncbi:hypothetical protein OPKNFCMD_3905 [Methylobacterium crusticola]|uniref:GNAT family N-acetyltransferase n=1 Tax=Methylobacterium crusticola TaxID=1697972 RepID=A0ABQ4R0S1_9HYPH|nr:N-acetyltransferase [Methylobacterium crusticola]GJD51153.1 hypothetical protein OPKNFCMD_3905 [Methylobacterium crusticola]
MPTLPLPLPQPLGPARARAEAGPARGLRTAWLRERRTDIGLRRDLHVPHPSPEAAIPISVREAIASDASAQMFSIYQPGLTPEEREAIALRRAQLRAGIATGFVAIDGRSGAPCHVQWLLGADQNAEIQALGAYPLLEPGEALLAGAYTPVAYRGLGIGAAATALIAKRGLNRGARHILTFAGGQALRECERAGFRPVLERRIDSWWFGLRPRATFAALPDAGAPSR